MCYNRSSKTKYRTKEQNLQGYYDQIAYKNIRRENLINGLTESADYDIITRALLDSSLISQTNSKKYDVKVVQCGNYYQVYKFNKKKIIINKNVNMYEKEEFKVKTETVNIKLSKKEIIINNEYKKYYSNPMYNLIRHKPTIFDKSRVGNITHLKEIDNTKEKELLLKNINRSKNNLKKLVKSNEEEFKTFITLTFEENLKDVEIANKKFNIWRTYIKRLKKDFKYVCVPEFQKRGAVHYHLLTNIEYSDFDLLSKEERKIYNHKSGWQIGRDIKGWKYGIHMVKNMDNINVVGYLTKYMTKDIDNRLWGKRKYLYSQNLKQPSTIYLDIDSLDELVHYFDILDCNITYNSAYINVFDEKIDFIEYKKNSSPMLKNEVPIIYIMLTYLKIFFILDQILELLSSISTYISFKISSSIS